MFQSCSSGNCLNNAVRKLQVVENAETLDELRFVHLDDLNCWPEFGGLVFVIAIVLKCAITFIAFC